MTNLIKFPITLLFLALISPGAHADDQWDFRLTPYIWFAGFKGEVAPIKGVPPSQEDISSHKAFDDTEASYMIIIDAKKGTQGVFTDIFYSDINSEEDVIPGALDIQSITKTTMITVGYQREILNVNNTIVDLLAGVRWWNIDATLKIRSPIPALNLTGDNTESWFDPFVGVKGQTSFKNSKFYVSGGIGYGGFSINAKSFYDISANLGYQWSNSIGTAFGYRQFELDYDENDFLYDVKQSGWQIGLTWSF